MRGPWGQCVATWLLYLSWEWWSDLGVSVCGHFTAVSVIVNEGTLGSVCVATSLLHISQCEWEDLRGWVWPLHCYILQWGEGTLGSVCVATSLFHISQCEWEDLRGWVWPLHCSIYPSVSKRTLGVEYGDFTTISYNKVRRPWGQCVWPLHCSIYPSVSKRTLGVEYGHFTAISYNEVRRPCGQCLATSLQYLSLWMRGPWGQCVWPPHCSIYPSVSKMTMWGLSMATSLLYLTMRWEDLGVSVYGHFTAPYIPVWVRGPWGVEYGHFIAISYNEVRRPLGLVCVATSLVLLLYIPVWVRGPCGPPTPSISLADSHQW